MAPGGTVRPYPSVRDGQLQPELRIGSLRLRRGDSFTVEVSDLILSAGSVILAGPNGSGKSTLLAALAGLFPLEGDCLVSGVPLQTQRAQEMLGYMAQDPRGLEHLRLRDALAFVGHLYETSVGVRGVAGELGITDLLDRPMGKMSGGEKRLGYLAVSVAHRPPVILLDEPTVGIDAAHRSKLRTAIESLAQNHLVVTASHLPEDIERLGQRTIVMRHGRIIFDGTAQELRQLGEEHGDGTAGPIESGLVALEVGD
jgi:ABC-2 type transport system ATP-binding protein